MQSDGKRFTHNMNVRIDDITFGNHLCHSKFINIIHNTRALFLKKHHLSEINCFGHALIMLNLNIDYINQCLFDDLLEISLSLDVDKASLSFHYIVFNQTRNKLAAKATTLMGFFDIKKEKLRRTPSAFLDLINRCSS